MAHSDSWSNRLKGVALGLGLALTALTIRHWCSTFTYGHPPCSDCAADFPGLYAGAKLIWQTPSVLYEYEHQLAIQKTIDPRIGESILPFAYPPFTALVLIPLGWLPFRIAFATMTLVNAGLLSFALILLNRRLGLNKDQSVWLLLTTFCNFGVHSVLLQGQTSFVLLSCLIGFMFAVLGDRQFAAGFWSGCIFFKPQFLAVPMIVLVFQRLWRALFLAGVILIALCAVSIFLVGHHGISNYLQLLKFYGTTESGFGSYPQHMHNLRALVQFFVPFSYAPYLWFALVVAVAALSMWMNTINGNGESSKRYLWLGNFLSMMLLTPHLYPHDLSLMIVPSAFILRVCGASVPLPVASSLIALGVLPILPRVLHYHMPPVLAVVFLIALAGSARLIQQRVVKHHKLELTVAPLNQR